MSRVQAFPPTLFTAVAGGLLLGVVLAMAQQQKQAADRNSKWDFNELAKVPARDRTRKNPLEGDADAVAAGAKLFGQECAECHGKDSKGGKRGPSLRVDAIYQATPGELFFVVTNGVIRHGMPGWSNWPEPERWQVVSFLKSLHNEPQKQP